MDRDELVSHCIRASEEADAQLAVRDVLKRFITESHHQDDVAKPAAGWLDFWHVSSTLTVLNAVWPPDMMLFPHDHRMWAAIAIYAGQEDNTFYRRREGRLVPSGGKELHHRDVLLLGDDTIHAVHNPRTRSCTGAIHIYGGDFVNAARSQWDPETLIEEPYDLGVVRARFEAAERAYEASRIA